MPSFPLTEVVASSVCPNDNSRRSDQRKNETSKLIWQRRIGIRRRLNSFSTQLCFIMALLISLARSTSALHHVTSSYRFEGKRHVSLHSAASLSAFLHDGGRTPLKHHQKLNKDNPLIATFTNAIKYSTNDRSFNNIQPYISNSNLPLSRLYSTKNNKNDLQSLEESQLLSDLTLSGYQRPKVNWYPGHIAKAERQLSETLKSVDVVIEVRDARAPKATAHPSVGKWTAGRPRVVVLTRVDMVTVKSRESWREAYEAFGAERWEASLGGEERNRNAQMRRERRRFDDDDGDDDGSSDGEKRNLDGGVEEVLFVDAKRGQGTHAITRAIHRAGRYVNERRKRRGLNERPLRVGIIGFPNVGKSALINRLLGRKRARTANTPGVTRSLQWIRVAADKSTAASGSGSSSSRREFELLDSPGIIPSDMIDQTDALLLAACNSVGVGAYDNQAVAAYLCDRIQSLVLMGRETTAAPQWRAKCQERYGFDPIKPLSEQNIAARWGSENIDGSAKTWIDFAAANQDRIPTGEDMLFIVADNTCKGDPENAARKILQDFRTGRMGPVSLQLAPESEADEGQQSVTVLRQEGLTAISESVMDPTDFRRMADEQRQREKEEIEERAKAAREAAKEKGLDLPPVMDDIVNEEVEDKKEEYKKPAESEIGKGLFDGW
mmetsp:Transcript_9134/g.20001  ORF Transcript_9134/g.20001 Transcript_9134/m.20001 type:complete len:665 (-) Transcript_9134:93-2087(-)